MNRFAVVTQPPSFILYNLVAIVLVTLRTRRFLINDDHMIWNCRKRLERIASACAPVSASPWHQLMP